MGRDIEEVYYKYRLLSHMPDPGRECSWRGLKMSIFDRVFKGILKIKEYYT